MGFPGTRGALDLLSSSAVPSRAWRPTVRTLLFEPAFVDPSAAGLRPRRVLAAFNREGSEMLEADLALACRFFEFFFEIELPPNVWSQGGVAAGRCDR
jgi:hypothetical protein